MPTVARDTGTQLVHFIRKTINFAVQASSTSFELGTIPANALVIGDGVYVSTFPDGTTNVLDIGYTSDSLSTLDVDAYATALALPLTTGNKVALDELTTAGSRKRSVDTTLTAQWRGTATTGIIDIVISYVLDK